MLIPLEVRVVHTYLFDEITNKQSLKGISIEADGEKLRNIREYLAFLVDADTVIHNGQNYRKASQIAQRTDSFTTKTITSYRKE